MKNYAAMAVAVLALMLVVLALGGTARVQASSEEDNYNPTKHGMSQLLIDKELSSADRLPTSESMNFPKAVTVCLYNGGNALGYDPNVKLRVESSIDRVHWFPATVAGTERLAEATNACIEITPTRYIRVGWPLSANVPSPGPKVTAMVEASY